MTPAWPARTGTVPSAAPLAPGSAVDHAHTTSLQFVSCPCSGSNTGGRAVTSTTVSAPGVSWYGCHWNENPDVGNSMLSARGCSSPMVRCVGNGDRGGGLNAQLPKPVVDSVARSQRAPA